jgi:hypothetical protein
MRARLGNVDFIAMLECCHEQLGFGCEVMGYTLPCDPAGVGDVVERHSTKTGHFFRPEPIAALNGGDPQKSCGGNEMPASMCDAD